MSESTYRNTFALSQSSIKDWRNMPPIRWYQTWVTKEIKREQSDATTGGSLLDAMCYTPEEVDKRFIVSDIVLPSDNVCKIVKGVFNHITELNANAEKFNSELKKGAKKMPIKKLVLDDKELIISLSKEYDYYVKTPDRAYNEIMKSGPEYFEFLKKTDGKKVITAEDKKIAEELKEILFTDVVSKGFFVPKKHCEVIFQQQIFAEFELSGYDNLEVMPMKGMLDTIHINHKRKEIREVDLKRTNDAFSFKEAIKRFDYAGQHSIYNFLITEWIKTFDGGRLKDYAIMNPLNVVIDDVYKTPYLYEYNASDLHIKRFGLETDKRLVIPGWEHSVNEIAYHIDKAEWKRPKEHLMNGRMFVNIFHK